MNRRSLLATGFQQGAHNGMCGLYCVVNAIDALFPGLLEDDEVADSLVARLARSMFPASFQEAFLTGFTRIQVAELVVQGNEWLAAKGHALAVRGSHPDDRGITRDEFWRDKESVMRELAGFSALSLPVPAVAIVGFGDAPGSGWHVPHWTVVRRIGPMTLTLHDSDEYQNVLISKTALRYNEDGWRVEDCFIIGRAKVSNAVI